MQADDQTAAEFSPDTGPIQDLPRNLPPHVTRATITASGSRRG